MVARLRPCGWATHSRRAESATFLSFVSVVRFASSLVRFVPLVAFVALLHPSPLSAQTQDDPIAALRGELDELRRQYEERLGDLDRRLTELETENAALREAAAATQPAAPPPLEPPPPPVSGPTGDATQTSNYFNPAISVIGNFLGVAGNSGDGEDLPSAELRESEISFQAVIDPYARADVFLAFGEEGVEVEEGFVTLTALPANLLAKVGRMRAGFGKVNTLHLHLLPWADEPLPLVNLLGGEEGWVGTGVSLAGLIPLPADTFSEATVQVFGGDSELFESLEREDLAYNVHYRVFRDLSDSTNLDVGLSWAHGPNGLTTSSDTELWGLDAAYRWKPLQRATYQGLRTARRGLQQPARPGRFDPSTRSAGSLRASTSSPSAGGPVPATSGPSAPTRRRSTTAARR